MITGLQQLSQQGTVTATGQGALGKALLQTGQAAGASTAQLKKLQEEYAKTATASKSATAGITTLLTGLRGLAGVLGITVGVAALVHSLKEFAVGVVQAGIENERLMLSLKGALGTAQAAGEAYQFVEGVANRLGIGLVTAVEGFAKLSAATQGTIVQGEATRALFVSLAEASRVMGLTTAETGGVVTALTQIIGKNTVSMEELRQQLGERLPQVLRLTAKEMGVTTSAFIAMVSKGEVLAQDFIPAVTRAFQQMGKEAPAASASVQAALERLGNAWLTLKVTIAQSGILPLVATITEAMVGAVNQVTNLINRTKRMAGELGLAPMVQEMQRITQNIQIQQEKLAAAPAGSPMAANARNETIALEAQRDALAANIAMKQQSIEKDESARKATDASTKADIENAAAQDKQVESIRKASTAWTGMADDIKEAELALTGLRSFDVESLKALQIDPFKLSPQEFEQQWQQAETFFLKRIKDLRDKQAGISKSDATRATQEAGQSAVERAKAAEDALATGLKNEITLIKQSADERRRIADETATAELMAEGSGAVEAIALRRSETRKAIAIEEAQSLEKIELDGLKNRAEARESVLKAEIAAAGKNTSAAVAAQAELNNLQKDTAAQRVAIESETAKVVQGISKKSVDEQIKHAQDLNKIIKETEQDRIQARIDVSDDQIALIEAQVDGEVLTLEQGYTQIRAIMDRRLEDTRQLYILQADAAIAGIAAEVRETEIGQAQILKIKSGLNDQLRSLDLRRATEEQEFLNKQVQAYERFVDKVSSGLASIFEGLMNGTLNLLDSFKQMFLRTLSQLVAEAASRVIVVPIVTAVLGAIGGGLGPAIGQAIGLAGAAAGVGSGSGSSGSGSLLETGGTALTGLGLAKSVYSMLGLDTLTNYVGTGLTSLKDTMLVGLKDLFQSSATQAAEQALLEGALVEQGSGITPAGQAAGFAGQAAGIAGGLAALGTGIYAAINASNAASKAAFAASAAAGAAAAATAAYGAVTGAALVTAGGTGWTGIGLIVAAVMAVIGVVLDRVIKPAGPSLSVGRAQGLNVVAAGDQLGVQGDLGTSVTRRVGVTKDFASQVQAQMEEGVTSAVQSVIMTINAVALDPVALLGPTQDALQTALKNLQPLNTASAKKMERDITEQLAFINIAIVGGMLEPVNLAFDQLRDKGDLKQQAERLPGTVSGLVAIFKNLNVQLDEISKSENTDVLRQLSGVRNQVENFGNRIAGTAGQIAESIVSGVIKDFEALTASGFSAETVQGAMAFDATGAAVTEFDRTLAEQITDFNAQMTKAFQALGGLRTTQQTLEGVGLPGGGVGSQIDRLTKAMSEQAARVSTQIVSTALGDLSTQLDQVLIQPIGIQATTVNSLFTDSMAALQALWLEWHRLEEAGIDAGRVREQFDRLLTGILDSTTKVLDDAFETGSFSEFLNVLAGIPASVMALNPAFAKLQQIGAAFGQVVGPIAQSMAAIEDSMRTTAERITFTSDRITDLKSAINDAGDSADRALPLYAQLSQAVLANAELQIEVIKAIEQAWQAAMDQVQGDIDTIEEGLGSLSNQLNRAVADMIVSADAFNQAAASGDTLAAIEAIQEYEQALVTLAELQIKQVEAHRQATIDAQQAIIDVIQDQVDAQQKVIDAIQSEADAQQKVIDGTQELIDAQQKVIDGIHDQMEAQQEVIDAIQDQIDAQQKVIDGTQKQIDVVNDAIRNQKEYIDLLQEEVNAREEAVDSLTREVDALTRFKDRVDTLVRGGLPPARQASVIRADMAATQARLMVSGGDDAIKELERLIDLNEELIRLGEENDMLVFIKEGLDNLGVLQGQLNAQLGTKEGELSEAERQLKAVEGTLKAAEAQLDVQEAQLDTLNAQLEFERAQLDGLIEQQNVQKDVLKAIEDQLKPAEAQLDTLNAQLEFERAQLDAINARLTLEQAALTALTDQLKEQQDILKEIEDSNYWAKEIANIQGVLLIELNNVKKWLAGVEGYTTWEDQIIAIQNDSLVKLREIESDLKYLFLETVANTGAAGISVGLQQRMVGALDTLTTYNLKLPVKTEVSNFYDAPHQRGGIVGLPSGLHYAQGGMVPTLLEPGERVFTSPTSAQQGALMAMNKAWPRFASGGFTVPGHGSGDSVPMMLPPGSFVLNRNAAGTLGRQDGGSVPGSSTPPSRERERPVNINVDLRGAHFSDHNDLKRLEEMLERIRRKRGDTRL